MGLFEKLLRGMTGGHHGGYAGYGGKYGGAQLAAAAKFCAQCGKPRGAG